MNIADPSNVLFRIAHPSLYERNPFNILNLPVDATTKDIRRRREDIKAAFDSGTEAEEFGNILPGDEMRKLPTREEVADLFAQLEDPEMRIAHALFWFWPDVLACGSPDAKRKGHSNPNGVFGQADTIAAWGQVASAPDASTSTKLVARHNLAVFHHMMGLAYELALEKLDRKEVATPDYVNTYWETSIHWWNAIAGDVDFWKLVLALVSSLGDPRVDYRFARSLRDQFAFSFDQINVELAIGFAKTGRDADAKRQVKYMAISQPEADDVEGTFDNAFSGLLRQADAVVKAAQNETEKMPKDGLHQADVILSRTQEPLRVARIVLKKGSSVRHAICTLIFDGVRHCLILYGNETSDWEGCYKFTDRLDALAETEVQCDLVAKDKQVIKQNQMTGWVQQVRMLVQAAIDATDKNPKCGLQQAEKLIIQAQKWVDVARQTLPKGDSLRNAIVSTVFSGARSCIIAYGNETKDWAGCRKLSGRLQNLVETREQREGLAQDVSVLQKNQEEQELWKTCWFCKEREPKESCSVKISMYGQMEYDRQHDKIHWKTRIVSIPRCPVCKNIQEQTTEGLGPAATTVVKWSLGICLIIGVIIEVALFQDESNIFRGLFAGGCLGGLIGMPIAFVVNFNDKSKKWDAEVKYPEYLALREQGWQRGDRPSLEEMRTYERN